MITILRGRKLSLQGTEDGLQSQAVIYAEVAVALRDQIYHFNTGKNCNSRSASRAGTALGNVSSTESARS